MSLFFISFILFIVLHHRYYWKVEDTNRYHYNEPIFISHRGEKSDKPENTLPAFKDALDNGFTWIELDIITSKDGVIFCSHNFDLERETNGSGYLNELTSESLNTLYTGIYHQKNSTTKIPTLDEVVSSLPENTGYNIEIKAPVIWDMTTARALLSYLGKSPKIKCIVSSFNPFVVAYLRLFNRSINTGFLFQNLEYYWITHWIHPSYIHPRGDLINAQMLSDAKRHNMGVNAWTINGKDAINWCIDQKIDGIITDSKEPKE